MTKLPNWAKWVARDKDGELTAHKDEPEKDLRWNWWSSFYEEPVEETDNSFAHVSWYDEEPTPVKTISNENSPTEFPRLNNELTKHTKERSDAMWKDVFGDDDPLENLKEAADIGQESIVEHEKKKIIEPIHYKNDHQGKYTDLFDKWYHENDIVVFRAIMRATAERYITRYENKNGVIDLEKGIYTLERLKEYEELEE